MIAHKYVWRADSWRSKQQVTAKQLNLSSINLPRGPDADFCQWFPIVLKNVMIFPYLKHVTQMFGMKFLELQLWGFWGFWCQHKLADKKKRSRSIQPHVVFFLVYFRPLFRPLWVLERVKTKQHEVRAHLKYISFMNECNNSFSHKTRTALLFIMNRERNHWTWFSTSIPWAWSEIDSQPCNLTWKKSTYSHKCNTNWCKYNDLLANSVVPSIHYSPSGYTMSMPGRLLQAVQKSKQAVAFSLGSNGIYFRSPCIKYDL